MRIIRYSKKLVINPWLSYELEVKESDLPGLPFERIIAAVKEAGFDYVIVDQPSEVVIEHGVAEQPSRCSQDHNNYVGECPYCHERLPTEQIHKGM